MAKKTVKAKKKVTNKEEKKIPAQKVSIDESVQLLAKNEVIAGNYCNIAVIHHTEREFVLDFIFALANQHSLVSRVITNPKHIKKIYQVLGENLKKYEEKYGDIKV